MPEPGKPSEERVLAIDLGERRVGLAVGSLTQRLAMRFDVVDCSRYPNLHVVASAIGSVGHSEGCTRYLVGLPLNMDGSEGEMARRAREFGRHLARLTGLPVDFADERLTTEAAREAARQAGVKHPTREILDDLAAAVLLQGWFDELTAREARERLNDS